MRSCWAHRLRLVVRGVARLGRAGSNAKADRKGKLALVLPKIPVVRTGRTGRPADQADRHPMEVLAVEAAEMTHRRH